MATEAAERERDHVETRGVKTYPLNSTRLTASVVSRIAAALRLPKASLADSRQMIDGSLAEEREPQNVQVELVAGEGGSTIRLRDAGGVFLEVPPTRPDGEDSSLEREKDGDDSGREGHGRGSSDGSGEGSDGEGASTAAAELESARGRVTELEAELRTSAQRNTELEEEVRNLSDRLREEKNKYSALWRLNCDQLREYDEAMAAKEEELLSLGGRLATLGGGTPPTPTDEIEREVPRETGRLVEHAHTSGSMEVGRASLLSSPKDRGGTSRMSMMPDVSAARRPMESRWTGDKRDRDGPSNPRRGKAPPVDPFNGETTDTTFEDWLPSLQRAAEWNCWSDEETLIQLAGHLRGRVLQEWTLLRNAERESLPMALDARCSRLDPGSKVVAAQDFRHAALREGEAVTDYICRLEQLFRRAYGHEGMSDETRDTLLHSQLQEGLSYAIM